MMARPTQAQWRALIDEQSASVQTAMTFALSDWEAGYQRCWLFFQAEVSDKVATSTIEYLVVVT